MHIDTSFFFFLFKHCTASAHVLVSNCIDFSRLSSVWLDFTDTFFLQSSQTRHAQKPRCCSSRYLCENLFYMYVGNCVCMCVCVYSVECVCGHRYTHKTEYLQRKYLFARSSRYEIIFALRGSTTDFRVAEFNISVKYGELSTVFAEYLAPREIYFFCVCARTTTAALKNGAHFAFLRKSFASWTYARMCLPLSWWDPTLVCVLR